MEENIQTNISQKEKLITYDCNKSKYLTSVEEFWPIFYYRFILN